MMEEEAGFVLLVMVLLAPFAIFWLLTLRNKE